MESLTELMNSDNVDNIMLSSLNNLQLQLQILKEIVKSKQQPEQTQPKDETQYSERFRTISQMSKGELVNLLNKQMLENQAKDINNEVNLELQKKQRTFSNELKQNNFYDIY